MNPRVIVGRPLEPKTDKPLRTEVTRELWGFFAAIQPMDVLVRVVRVLFVTA